MRQSRIGFVFTYLLGHVTHQKNLEPYVSCDASIDPAWMLLPPRAGDLWDTLPLVRNHMPLRLSLRARAAIKSARREGELDVLFYHTHAAAMLGVRLARRVPTVISLDATPIDFAQLGAYHRDSRPRPPARSGLRFRWNQAMFRSAAGIITWSSWCKRSVVRDYGVDESNVTVIPPGVDLARWTPWRRPATGEKPRALFVGGDFNRKGGRLLLEAFRGGLSDYCDLDIVSGDAPQCPGVRIHRGLSPNSRELRKLHANADLFVLPTSGDCSSFAAIEAMASGLPVVLTSVGGLSELVETGRNGFLIPPGDPAALIEAVKALATDPVRRAEMGRAARDHATQHFNADKNYPAILTMLKRCPDAARGPQPLPQIAADDGQIRKPAA